MTIQIAIPLTPQPLSTGPTRFLPYSNQLATGYLNIRRPEFSEWVGTKLVQMPLDAGDMVVFNPTTFHQPGTNETNVHRVMHLFQVNSCMSRPMDTKDTLAMTKAVWPTIKKWSEEMKSNSNEGGMVSSYKNHPVADVPLQERFVNGTKTERHPLELEALIAATAEDYDYPHNSDKKVSFSHLEQVC